MRVVVTGVSSYTGMCIAEAFAKAGATVTGTLTRTPSDYSGRKALRLERAARAGVTFATGVEAESGELSPLAAREQADVWVHHHHPMKNFRSPEYDTESARQVAVAPLETLTRALKDAGTRTVLLSGTYFEPGEGGQRKDAQVTPYARLKHEVGREMTRLCHEHTVSAHQIIITTPVGALENEDRLTPQMLLCAASGRPFALRSEASIFDVLPGEDLGRYYLRAAEQSLRAPRGTSAVHRPSGWIVSARDWARWVEKHLAEPLGLRLSVEPAVPQAESTSFFNPESERLTVDWKSAAQRYVEEWKASAAHF